MKRYLVLENGSVWEGEAFGADDEVTAELVFTTESEYMSNFADGSYAGQIVVQTFPMLGDYGEVSADLNGKKPALSGYIVRDWCTEPSNFRSEGSIDDFLKRSGVVGLCGIDTRALCRTLRKNKPMNAMLTSNPDKADIDKIKAYKVSAQVQALSVKSPKLIKSEKGKYTVAMLDMGGEAGEAAALVKRGCDVWKLSYNSGCDDIMSHSPDAVLISAGPGDPCENTEAIQAAKKLMELKVPLMGVGLGHQVIALAAGLETYKMKTGHRGSNQPVCDMESGYIYIESQNHGYAVKGESLKTAGAKLWFSNVNDGSVEGLIYSDAPALGVQFRPDSGGEPRDTGFVYDRFIALIDTWRK